MPLEPAVTAIEQLKDRTPLATLLEWNPSAIQEVRFDRGELTIWLAAGSLLEAVRLLRDDARTGFTFLSDITCVDWYPSEPRFEVVYTLLSMKLKQHLRLKVRLCGEDANVDSLYSLFPSCNFFEREVFDLFGVRFHGHPDLRRIMMPEGWEGHPLRKDYPVEGYR